MTATFWLWSSPLWGPGYQFWSGIGANAFLLVWAVTAILWARHHNCHVRGCWRLHWHPSDAHGGHPVCRKHHPDSSDPSHPLGRRTDAR